MTLGQRGRPQVAERQRKLPSAARRLSAPLARRRRRQENRQIATPMPRARLAPAGALQAD
jgi:hypothetical protein